MIWLTVAAFAIGIATNLDDLFGFGGATASGGGSADATQLTLAPCPLAVSSWLPGGGDGAVLVAAYTTEKHEVAICREPSGQLFYDGRVKGAPPGPATHITLRATETANGFIANNKSYVYEIKGQELIVSNNGRELSRAPLTRTGP